MIRLLHKAIAATVDQIAVAGECYFVGAELSDAAEDAFMMIYGASSAVAADLITTLRVSAVAETQWASIMLPLPGIKCKSIYVNIDGAAGTGTIFYYLKD